MTEEDTMADSSKLTGNTCARSLPDARHGRGGGATPCRRRGCG